MREARTAWRTCVLAACVALLTACAGSRPGAGDTAASRRQVAKEAYLYAYPMLYNYKTIYAQALDTASPAYVGGFNRFRHYSRPYTPANTEIVTPNNDTPYSWAWLDLRAEPMVLSVPAIAKPRYNVFQLVDLYTYNFAYVGVRATGYKAGNYLIAGPGWHGATPHGITQVIRAESYIVGVLGRTSSNGPADVKNVQRLQTRYGLRPLSTFERQATPPPPEPVNWMVWDEARATSVDFIAYLNQLLLFAQPPDASERALMARFATIGIAPGQPFHAASLPQAEAAAIAAGVADAKAELTAAEKRTRSSVGLFGSRQALHGDYTQRAVAAAMGIYGNSQEEAIYLGYEEDDKGARLDGKTPYAITFSKGQLPPATFFWSMTMYDLPGRHLVANPIQRYAIGDRTPGLRHNKDGSLTIYVQHEAPAKSHRVNWLPAPEGPYNIVMRIYGPKPSAFDGSWSLPKPVAAD